MASYRFRIGTESVSGGVPTESSVVGAAQAGNTADFMDLFVDNADIKSEAHLATLLENLKLGVLRIYRQTVGGVSS